MGDTTTDFSLNLDNLLSDEQIASLNQPDEAKTPEDTGGQEEKIEKVDTEDPTIEDLFGSESVGGKQEIKSEEKEDIVTEESDGKSPENQNLYSSIAEAFRGDDIFPDLSDDEIKAIKSADDFRELVVSQMEKNLTDEQKRIKTFMDGGANPSEVKFYVDNINALKQLTDEHLEGTTDESVNLRKALIKASYINRGYKEDRADALTQRSFDNNADVEDAKIALQENLDFYTGKYNDLYKESERQIQAEKEELKRQTEELEKSVLGSDATFAGVKADEKTKKKVFDVITKPVYKEGDVFYTELQKYEKEHHADFMKMVGYLYVITDGFKSLDKVEKQVETKAKKKGIADLENTLKMSVQNNIGDLRYVSGVNDAPPEFGMAIDI